MGYCIYTVCLTCWVPIARIKSNFQQVTLSQEDYETVSAIGHNNHTRFNTPITYPDQKWDINIFEEEAEKGATHQIKIV